MNKYQHRTNSNDLNVKRRTYITNINGHYFEKEREMQNHSNVDINMINRDFSSSSILSSNSQIKQNKNNIIYNENKRKRDFSSNSNVNNINNNTYNDIIQLKTEISERTKSTYFNNKNNMNLENNNYINNINNIKLKKTKNESIESYKLKIS